MTAKLSSSKLLLAGALLVLLLGESLATNSSSPTTATQDGGSGSDTTPGTARSNNTTVNANGGDVSLSIPNPIDDVTKFANDTKNLILDTLRNMTQYLPVNILYAEVAGRNCNIIEYNKDYYSVPGLIIAAVMFLIGVLFCFLGYRLIKINLFVLGFAIGGSFTYVLFLSLLKDVQGDWKLYTALGLMAVVGALVGALLICIYYIGVFLAGGSIGFLVAWLILSAIDIPFFQTHVYVPILIAAGAGIVCGIVALIFQKWLVIIGTSIIGSFILVWSLDYYIELGQMIYFLLMFAAHRESLQLCWFSWALVGLFPLLVVASLLVQFLLTGRKYDHKKDFGDRGICCGLCKKCKKKRSDNYIPLKSAVED